MQRGIFKLILSLVLTLPAIANAAIWNFAGGINSNQENTHSLNLPSVYFGAGLLSASLDDVTGSFQLSAYYAGLTGEPVAAHIHDAPPGVAGPIVFDLGATTTTAPGIGSYNLVTTLNAAQIASLTNNGSAVAGDATNFYVNIHTAANPDGEIRGQLLVAQAPAPVPVPAAVWLFGSALVGTAIVRRKR